MWLDTPPRLVLLRCSNLSLNCLFLLGLICAVGGIDNGLGLVPPMGWNSWNKFFCDINETVVMRATDKILELGLAEAGYNYVNVDDCWMAENRTEDGRYQADATKFPSGMKKLGDYIHDRGLKFGLYTSAGTGTCQKLPGSLGHEVVDAQTFADWGVDYLKYDNCNAQKIPSIDRYPVMRDALNQTGRPIFYSLCQWGTEESWKWAPSVGNSWRTTKDIEPTWNSIVSNFWESQRHFERSRKGAWADPDMLEVGNGHLTLDEERSHFALWVMAKSPLLLGMDLDALTKERLEIISHRSLIAVHQDPQSTQCTCFLGCDQRGNGIGVSSDFSVFATTVSGGDTVAILVNWSDRTLTNATFAGQDIGVVPSKHQGVKVISLWADKMVVDKPLDFDGLKQVPLPNIPPHGNIVYRFTIVSVVPDQTNGPGFAQKHFEK